VTGDAFSHASRKHFAIDRERGASGNARRIGRFEHDAPQKAHLGLQQPVGVAGFGALEGVRAYQLREAVGLMRGRAGNRAHLMEYHPTAALGELPRGLAASEAPTNYAHRTSVMDLHPLTIAPGWSRADRHFLVGLTIVCGLTGCSSGQAIQRPDVPSAEESWVNSACSPESPDFSAWPRRSVGGVTVGAPPGYTVLQGPPTNILFQGPARRSYGGFNVVQRQESQQNYDRYFYAQHTYRNACSAPLSGYAAQVVATFDRGKYTLYARWDANQWGGGDAGKWLEASISSPRVEEAIELRAILHTMRPAGPGR